MISETSHRATAIVNRNRVWELRPGKRVNFKDVMQEFNQLVGMLANVYHVVVLIQCVVVTTHLLDAASGRTDDAVIALEDVNEELLRPPRIELVATVGHRLTAASLIQRIIDIKTEFF
jgi:hypothetical protein